MATHQDSCFLLTLPVELLEVVSLHVPAHDLLALRATCRVLNSATKGTFDKNAYRDVAYLLHDAWSMKSLYDISAHARLSRYVHTVRLSFACLLDGKQFSRQEKDALLPDEARSQKLQKACDKYVADASSQYGMKHGILRAIFAHFIKSGITPEIIARGDELSGPARVCGYRKLANFCGASDFVALPGAATQEALYKSYGTLYRSLVIAQFPVQYLELGSHGHGVPLAAFDCGAVRFGFQHLKTLRLVLSPVLRSEWQVDYDADSEKTDTFDVAFLFVFIGSAPSLRTFSLEIEEAEFGGCSTLFREMVSTRHDADLKLSQLFATPLPQVEEVELVAQYLDPPTLYTFVGDRTSFRAIRMRNIQDSETTHEQVSEVSERLLKMMKDRESPKVEIVDCWTHIMEL